MALTTENLVELGPYKGMPRPGRLADLPRGVHSCAAASTKVGRTIRSPPGLMMTECPALLYKPQNRPVRAITSCTRTEQHNASDSSCTNSAWYGLCIYLHKHTFIRIVFSHYFSSQEHSRQMLIVQQKCMCWSHDNPQRFWHCNTVVAQTKVRRKQNGTLWQS